MIDDLNEGSHMSDNTALNTLKYWYMEEFLLPQEIDSPAKMKKTNKNLFAEKGEFSKIMRETELKIKENITAKDEYVWDFTFYGGMFKVDKIRTTIEAIIPSTKFSGFEERSPSGYAASYSLSFSSSGKYKPSSLQISTAPWAIKHIVSQKKLPFLSYDQFEEVLDQINEDLDLLASDETIKSMKEFIFASSSPIKKIVGDTLLDDTKSVFQIVGIKRKVRSKPNVADVNDLDFLNSFYLPDLSRTLTDFKSVQNDALLSKYLNTEGIEAKIDVRDPDNVSKIQAMLHPSKLPDGCWPAEGKHPLVFSQQFAINAIADKLSVNDSGIYSVNGPPGTGKTTMLRDLIAHIMVERAKIIASFSSASEGFEKQKIAWKSGTTENKYYPLNPKLLGYEIVIASSNNGAVENVTMEIPAKESIDASWLSQIDYYKELGDEIIGNESWGLGAAKLGSSKNKNNFIMQFMEDKFKIITRINEETGKEEKETIVEKEGFISLLSKAMKTGPSISFAQAKEEFNTALESVQTIKKEKSNLIAEYNSAWKKENVLKSKISSLKVKEQQLKKELPMQKKQQEEVEEALKILYRTQKDIQGKVDDYRQKVEVFSMDIEKLLLDNQALLSQIKLSSTFLYKILNFFRPSRKDMTKVWGESYAYKTKEIEEKQNQKTDLLSKNEEQDSKALDIENARKEKEKESASISTRLRDMREELEKSIVRKKAMLKEQSVLEARNNEVIKTLRKQNWDTKDEEAREKTSPLTSDKVFQEARTMVFIKGLALQKSFIESNAGKIKWNLSRIKEILKNKVQNSDNNSAIEYAVRDLWGSLFLCVPVISTTFASYNRLFPQLWNKKLGWLLIDEAGQAVAKAAVGAMKRSHRAVVVGDPLQLEPITGLSGKIQESLRREYRAPEEMLSIGTSVQKRADALQPWGTYLTLGEEAIWVGSPLRVHRRCHSPMFDISNRTTYSEMMIQGKEKSESSISKSRWIDVQSNTHSGHWIPEEGEAVRQMLNILNKEGVENTDMYLISPFKDVVFGLKCMFKGSGLKVGTIHTVQGKEAKVVFVVLGSDPSNEGARDWACEKPNLLNVAVTRAKDRLFIVGNKEKWMKKQYFDTAIACLDADFS